MIHEFISFFYAYPLIEPYMTVRLKCSCGLLFNDIAHLNRHAVTHNEFEMITYAMYFINHDCIVSLRDETFHNI